MQRRGDDTPTARAVRAPALVWFRCGPFGRSSRRWRGVRRGVGAVSTPSRARRGVAKLRKRPTVHATVHTAHSIVHPFAHRSRGPPAPSPFPQPNGGRKERVDSTVHSVHNTVHGSSQHRPPPLDEPPRRDGRARSTVQTVAAASSAEGVQRGPDGNGNGKRSVLGDAGGEGFTRGGREGVSHGLTTIYAPQNPREFSAPLVTMLASLAVVSRPAPEVKYRAAMLTKNASKQAFPR